MHPHIKVALGGVATAIAVAIPLVDDGLVVSEVLSIILAGMSGAGLTAVPAPRRT